VAFVGPKRVGGERDVQEVTAEIEPRVAFPWMTFGGQVPGPMIRVRRGDRVRLTLTNPMGSHNAHNIDMHAVPPGSCGVFELETPVPETIKLVDHAVTRVVWKGMLGMIHVAGAARPELFNPKPSPGS